MNPPAPGQFAFNPSGSFSFGVSPTPAHFPSNEGSLPPGFQKAVGDYALANDPAWSGAQFVTNQPDVIVQDWQGYSRNLLSLRFCVWEDRLRANHGMPATNGVDQGDTHILLAFNLDGATTPSPAGPTLAINGEVHAAMNFVVPAQGVAVFLPSWMHQVPMGQFWPPRVGESSLCQLAKGGDYVFGAPVAGVQVWLQPIVFVPGSTGYFAVSLKPTQVTL